MNTKKLSVLFIVFAVIVLIMHNFAIRPWMLDDSFISFRFAENFASGHGLVYNVGEKVEGYTCFLWVLLLALAKKIGFDIVFFSKIAGFTFSFLSLALLANSHRFIKRIDHKISMTAVVFLGSCGAFTAWASSGMETAMFTFLTLWSVLLFYSLRESRSQRKFLLLGSLSAALAMTRPEGMMIFVILFLHQMASDIKSRKTSYLYFLGSFLAIFVPYFIWRAHYYGFWLPNTFYVKVGFGIHQIWRGLFYAAKFILATCALLTPIVFFFFSGKQVFKKHSEASPIPSIVILYTIYVVVVGGDSMPAYRFFTPILPLLCLLSSMAIFSLVHKKSFVIFAAALIVCHNLLALRVDREIYDHIKYDQVAFDGKEAGIWLKTNASPDSVIATNAAGSLPYFSKLRTIDMLGLNDVHISHKKVDRVGRGIAGHEKGDGEYVLSLKPDFIQFESSLGSRFPKFLSDQEIYNSSVFHKLYEFWSFDLNSGKKLNLYVRKTTV